MANSGDSILGSSEQLNDICCQPCRRGGYTTVAREYCVYHSEYLCANCYTNHKIYKHGQPDKDSAPMQTDFVDKVVDDGFEKCTFHPSEVIEYFCETCDYLGCHACISVDHCQCESVVHIPDMVTNLASGKKFKAFYKNLKCVEERLIHNRDRISLNTAAISEMKADAQNQIQKQRYMINQFFDELEKKIDKKISDIEQNNTTTLKAATDRLNTLQREFDQINSDIESKKNGQNCELFIAMTRSKQKMKSFDEQLDELLNETRIQRYRLLPSEQIEAMMKTTTEICRMTTARLESVIDVQTSEDKVEPFISALTMVQGHFCVATDSKNKSIKVIDTKKMEVTSVLNSNVDHVCGVTSVNKDSIAVSVILPGWIKQIQFFSVSTSGIIIRTARQIDVAKSVYFLLASSNDHFLACTTREIHIINSDGTQIKSITNSKMFKHLQGIAVSPDGQTVYCSDYHKHDVTSLTLDGMVKATYTDENLKSPVGITVDSIGYVYVCSSGTKCIYQLTADLSKVQVLIEDVFGTCLTYSSTENKLCLSSSGKIRVFDLTP